MKNHPETLKTKRSSMLPFSFSFSFNEDWAGWGWTVFFSQLIIAFGLLIFGLTHLAFASRQLGDYTYGARIVQQAPNAQTTRLQIQGNLSWKNGVARIQDGETGAVYRLSDSDEVKSLYDQGVRRITVSGTLNGPDSANATIVVESLAAVR